MARKVLTLKMIRRELKDDARPVIDQAVSSIETSYEYVSRRMICDMYLKGTLPS